MKLKTPLTSSTEPKMTRVVPVQSLGQLAALSLCSHVPLLQSVARQSAAQLDVATFQGFVDALLAQGGAREVDYVHGDEALAQLAATPGHAGLHLATLGKSELIGRVARHGPLPRKSFSMGEADEKRFYLEARRIRPPAG